MGAILTTFKSSAGEFAPLAVIRESIRIFPDSLVMGVGFYSVLTMSFAFGMFFIALLESLAVFHGLRYANSVVGFASVLPTRASLTKACTTGFSSITMESLSMFGAGLRSAFPSAPMFILGVATSYILYSMSVLAEEIQVLGEEYSKRFYFAAIGFPILITFVGLFRAFYDCDYFSTMLVSVLLGGILGVALVEQNRRLLGESSLNLMGIPLLKRRTASGDKLYVCPTQSKI